MKQTNKHMKEAKSKQANSLVLCFEEEKQHTHKKKTNSNFILKKQTTQQNWKNSNRIEKKPFEPTLHQETLAL